MSKKILCALLVGTVAVGFMSCKPATVETEEKVKDYESKLEALDISGDTPKDSAISRDISDHTLEDSDFTGNTLKVQLSDKISVDAVITPSAYYQGKIGIYEFERANFDFEQEEFIEKINQYYGRQEVGYEDTGEYQWSVTPLDQAYCEPHRIAYDNEDSGWARYRQDAVNSENYYSFVHGLIATGYPVYKTIEMQEDDIPENVKELMDLVAGPDARMGGEFLSLTSEEEYLRMEEIYKRISDPSDDASEEGLETGLADRYRLNDGDFQNHPPTYAVECYELVGDTHIPLKDLYCCSYINRDKKKVPATSENGSNNEVWTNTDNHIYMYFSDNDELEVLDMEKHIKVSEKPVKEVEVLDVRQVIDIFYQKVKTTKCVNILYSVQLQYSGVVKEEDRKLEDYIYPVWAVQYYESFGNSTPCLYLDAVTGEEIPRIN